VINRSFRIPLLIAGLSLLLAIVLLFDLIQFLRGGFGWQWPYKPVPLIRVLPLIAALIVYVSGAFWLLRRAQKWPLLLWTAGAVVLLSLAALWVRSDDLLYELFIRTVSGVVSGPHLAGAEIDWSNWLNWPQAVAAFEGRSIHVLQSGPGLPLWYAALNRILAVFPDLSANLQKPLLPLQCHNYALLAYPPQVWASAWFGILMPVWAGLTVFPLYVVSRRMGGDGAAGLTVTWWPLIPALLAFTPTWNTIFPLLAVIAFWLLLRGLGGRAIWLLASGAVCGLLIFANYAPVPLLGLFGFHVLLHYRRQMRQAVIIGLWFGLGLALPWLLYGLASGLTPFDLD
jgi:hypothetical protein